MIKTVYRFALKLIVGLIIFVGLPMFSWGISDTGGFLANSARLGYVLFTLLAQLTVIILIPQAGRGSGKGKALVKRQQLALVIIQVISLALVICAPFCDRREIALVGSSDSIRFIGLALYAIGMFMMHWAEAVLGKQFSVDITIQEGHELITSGPFRYLRHPRYLGIIAFSIGIALVFRSILGLSLAGLLVVVLIWRIHDEETLMRQQFGLDWKQYAGRTWRLVPFVY
jgi:protein-S-isoprenylcysteine O-methyltransferase Ste14